MLGFLMSGPGLAMAIWFTLLAVHGVYGLGPEEMPRLVRFQLRLTQPRLQAGRVPRYPLRLAIFFFGCSALFMSIPFLSLFNPAWIKANGMPGQVAGGMALGMYGLWLAYVLVSYERARRRLPADRPAPTEWRPGEEYLETIRRPAVSGRFVQGTPFLIRSPLDVAEARARIDHRFESAIRNAARPNRAVGLSVQTSGNNVEIVAILRILIRGHRFDHGGYNQGVSAIRSRATAEITCVEHGTELRGQLYQWTRLEAMARRVAAVLIAGSLVGIFVPIVAYAAMFILMSVAFQLVVMFTITFWIGSSRRTALVDMLDAIADSVDGEIVQAGRERRGIRRVPLLGRLVRFTDPPQATELRKARAKRDRERLKART